VPDRWREGWHRNLRGHYRPAKTTVLQAEAVHPTPPARLEAKEIRSVRVWDMFLRIDLAFPFMQRSGFEMAEMAIRARELAS